MLLWEGRKWALGMQDKHGVRVWCPPCSLVVVGGLEAHCWSRTWPGVPSVGWWRVQGWMLSLPGVTVVL